MIHDLDKGQHFMVDEDLLSKIIEEADLSAEDIVLEVGSGKGALTKHLVGKVKKLICVEQDTSLTSPNDSVEFYNENILDIIGDLDFDALVANIPYHISEPLLVKLLSKKPKQITIVVGNTFAKKISGQSMLGAVLREAYDIIVVKTIDPISFNPQPKVMSALVVLKLKNEVGVLSTFYEFQSSKVKNYILKISEGTFSKKETKELIEKENFIFAGKKLYELSTEEFFELISFLKNKILS